MNYFLNIYIHVQWEVTGSKFEKLLQTDRVISLITQICE